MLIFLLTLIALISCSDDINKNNNLQPRIEYSDCTACLECIDEFDCPEDAIKFDTVHKTAYIDVNECTQCMKCIDDFECEDNAFKTDLDEIAPANFSNFAVTSDSVGYANIRFTAPGDDQNEGRIFEYHLDVLQDEQNIQYDYDFDDPISAGNTEEWNISNMPEDQTLTFKIQAFDEANNSNEIAETSVKIMAVEIDEIAPAQISNLNAIEIVESVLLQWTSVGDDENEGTASSYIIKQNTTIIDENNWDDSIEIEQNMNPQVSGNQELFLIENLESHITLYFAIKTIDNSDNISEISNIAVATPYEAEDLSAPSAISTLSAQIVDDNFVLHWIAVGDDEQIGTATEYDFRWSNSEITNDNFEDANAITDIGFPQISGTSETYTFTNVEINVPYYFAIKVVDDNDNWSGISNIINITIAIEVDETSPAQIDDFNFTIADSDIILNWTAVGDDGNEGTAAQYDLRYSTSEISESNFQDANQLTDVQTPAENGAQESYNFTVPQYDQTYYFAIKAIDEVGNYSDISNLINAQIVDPTDLINPASINDLTVVSGNASSSSSIKINFTATGDDENIGTVDHYIIKYFGMEITEENIDLAVTFDNSVQPQESGNSELINVTGLDAGTIYYFAVIAVDEAGNESALSNSPAGKIVYVINEAACHDCGQCINDCDYGAISDAGSYKTIDTDLCQGCGDCSCPFGLIHLYVMGYNQPTKNK